MQNFKVFTIFSVIFLGHIDQIWGRTSPMRCPLNEEYAVDAQRPQNTCKTYGCYNEFACPGSSETGGCYCKRGYARLFTNGPCISIQHPICATQLPPTPESCEKKGEVYNKYLGYRACENTCANYNYDCGTIMTLVATWAPWCDCKENYARLPNGKCVSVDDPQCSRWYMPSVANCKRRGNERYAIGPICASIPTCEYPEGPEFVCMAIGEMPQCYCLEGYLRNSSGRCVPKDEC